MAGKKLIFFTFVVIVAVIAPVLEFNAAIVAVPAFSAEATPLAPEVGPAFSIASRVGTLTWAPFQRAVATVPASDAEAGSIFALAVKVAARVAILKLAAGPGPPLVADASSVLTPVPSDLNH